MLTGLIGTGGAILLVGLALLIKKFRGHVPGQKSDQVLLTVAVGLMLAAGVEFTFVGAGRWVISAIHAVEGWVGPVGAVIVALIVLFLFLAVIVAIFRTAHEGALTIAFLFPLMCAVPSHGYPAQVISALKPPVQQLTALLQAKMGA
jgi:hypothetical protein